MFMYVTFKNITELEMVEDKFNIKHIDKRPKTYTIMEEEADSRMVAERASEYSSKGSNQMRFFNFKFVCKKDAQMRINFVAINQV